MTTRSTDGGAAVAASVDTDEPGTDEPAPIRLIGWLVPAPADRVRMIIDDLCLDIAIESVRRLDPDATAGRVPTRATVELAPRAVLLTIGPAAAWRELFRPGPRPFALAARPVPVSVTGHAEYLTREADYLRRHGLESSPDHIRW